jgi:hypothetical protein
LRTPTPLFTQLRRELCLGELRRINLLTADFGVVDLYRMVRTEGFAEGPTRPIVYVWRVRVNTNATCCQTFGSDDREVATTHIGARWEFWLHPTLSYDVIALPNSK